MIAAGPVIEQLYEDTNASTPDKQAKVLRRMNLAYHDICRMLSWFELRRSAQVSFVAGTPKLLPADLAGIDGIYRLATTSGEFRVYQPRLLSQLGNIQDAVYRYCFTGVVTEPLFVGQDGATINKWAFNVTGLPAGGAGEYVSFTGRMGIYKLETDSLLDLPFMEESVNGGGYTIRPPGTRYAGLYDRDASGVTDTVTLDYWALPPPISDPSQFIALPLADVLLTYSMIRCAGIVNIDEPRADRYRAEFADALSRARSLNPIYATPIAPTDAYGNTSGWGASP